MIYFVVPRDQSFGIEDYLQTWGKNIQGLLSVVSYEALPEWTHAPAGTYIFSALDQLTARGLGMVRELQGQLLDSPAGCRVLNDAKKARSRLDLLNELYRLGLNRHRALRATERMDGVSFPVFLHEESRHTGSLTPLLHSRKELESELGRAVLRGFNLADLLVVEYVDTADARGYYRKYTAYRVGAEIIARTLGRGRTWMLKAEGMEFSQGMIQEERDYVFSNPFKEELLTIFEVAGIDYGRIDFALKDGAIETWEINTNPSVGPSRHKVMPDEFGPVRQPIRDHFSRRFRAALEALDYRGPESSLTLTLPSVNSMEGEPIVLPPHSPGRLQRLAKRLGPARPILNGLARLLSPAVARAARLFRRTRHRLRQP